MRPEPVQRAVVQLPGQHPPAGAVGVHQEVEHEELDEELGGVAERLLVQRVQDRVPGPVGRRAGALRRRPLAELGRHAAERALVDPPVGDPGEGHAVVLELDDGVGGLAAHVRDRVLVAEPVRPLDGVVHVPAPVVRAHVAERGADPALRGHRVAARREHLGQAGRAEAALGQPERGAEPRAAGADHHDVVGVVDDVVAARHHAPPRAGPQDREPRPGRRQPGDPRADGEHRRARAGCGHVVLDDDPDARASRGRSPRPAAARAAPSSPAGPSRRRTPRGRPRRGRSPTTRTRRRAAPPPPRSRAASTSGAPPRARSRARAPRARGVRRLHGAATPSQNSAVRTAVRPTTSQPDRRTFASSNPYPASQQRCRTPLARW